MLGGLDGNPGVLVATGEPVIPWKFMGRLDKPGFGRPGPPGKFVGRPGDAEKGMLGLPVSKSVGRFGKLRDGVFGNPGKGGKPGPAEGRPVRPEK